MKKIYLILIIFTSLHLKAQIDYKVLQKCFDVKLLSHFKKLGASLPKTPRNEAIYFTDFNDIIDNYQGGVIIVEDSTGYNKCDIYIITHGDSIIYYDFTNNCENEYHPNPIFMNLFCQIPNLYKNEIKYQKLQKRFRNAFGSNFSHTAFWSGATFGVSCGEFGGPTDEMSKIAKLIISKNTTELLKYLTSSSTAMQLYGYYGFYKLKKKNYVLPNEIARIMTLIENKKGEIRACDGCDHSNQEIQWIIENLIKQ